MRVSIVAGLVGAALLASSPASHAEPGGNIDLNVFTPAMDSRGYLTVNASQVLGDKEFSFGLGSLDWGRHMLELDGAGSTYSVDNIISATLIAAVGLHAGPAELEFGASMPFTIMNGDRGPNLVNTQNPNLDQDYRFDGQGTGSLGLHFKTRFLKTSRPPHFGIGLMVSAYFQTTSPKDHFLGENTVVPEAILILDKEFGREGRLRMALNGGIRYRKTTTYTNDATGEDPAPPTNNNQLIVGSEIPYKFGIAYAISKQRFDVVGEVFGSIPLGTNQNYQPLEALAGIKLYLARNSFLSLGAGRGLLDGKGANPDTRAMIGIVFEPNIGDRDGDGLKDDVDKCPDDPEDFDGFEDEDGCPDPDNDRDGVLDVDDKCPLVPGPVENQGCPISKVGDRDGDGIPDNIDKCPDDPEDKDGFQDEDGCPDPDNDQDGIPDVDDLCPNDPEDKDGFEDEDGCPDPDNDHDRILDKDDKCPNEPETYNGFEDEDGCPDRGRVIVTDTSIEILDMVYFELDKDIIKPVSYPILDAVAATLQGNPSIQLVECQGHTDERGDDAYNLDLSDRRSKAVRKYLIDKGVDEKRLTAQGYGETQPLDRRHNEAAWAKNRRVAFLILKRASD
ncbi:MAG TPA: OmpA family protein [Kofleriaceae bacterium]|jgi:outer membrane protein OmpA-like peptidoglycan-associated protein